MTPKKAYFVILSILILTLIGGGAVYYFANNYLHSKAEAISELKAKVDILDLQLSNSRRAISEYEDYQHLDKTIDKVLPSDKVQSDLIGELIVFADQAGVTVTNINFAPTNSTDQQQALSQTLPVDGISGVNKLPMNIGLSGSYSSVLSFLNKVESNQRIMHVESISMNPDESGSIITASLIVNAFIRTK